MLCTDLLAFTLQLRKTSARRPSDEGAVRLIITSNGVPFLQMRSIRLHSTLGREKERTELDVIYFIPLSFVPFSVNGFLNLVSVNNFFNFSFTDVNYIFMIKILTINI